MGADTHVLVMREVEKRGCSANQLAKGLKVVGFDDILLCEIMDPPIMTIRQPLDLLMESAVDLLIGRMEGRNTNPPVHVTLELIVRGSTAPVASN